MSANGYRIEPIESAPFAEVSYLIWLEGATDALVVDPGFEPDAILSTARREGLRIVAILNTHGHVDHIAGNAEMKRAFPNAPLVIGRNEASLLGDPELNLSQAFGGGFKSPPADLLLDEGDAYQAGGFSFEILEIPGHSPGSIVYLCKQFTPAFAFAGDVLFAGSVGRTDLGGNTKLLLDGIKSKLLPLPADTVIYPGHGSIFTIGQEKKHNPFVGERAGLYGLD